MGAGQAAKDRLTHRAYLAKRATASTLSASRDGFATRGGVRPGCGGGVRPGWVGIRLVRPGEHLGMPDVTRAETVGDQPPGDQAGMRHLADEPWSPTVPFLFRHAVHGRQ